MKVRYALVMLALALTLAATAPLAVQAQQIESFVAKVAVSDDAVTFQPQGTYVGFNMQVTGPDAFYYVQNFKGNEVPSLTLKAEQMPDGPYTVRVTAQPIIEGALRARLEEARAQGDQMQMKKLFDEAGISRRSMVHSVNIGIADGKFIDPYAEEAPAKDLGANSPGESPSDLGALTPMQLSHLLLDGLVPASGPYAGTATTVATASSVQGALTPVALPASLAPYGDTQAKWYQAHFQNTREDGSLVFFEAFLSPTEQNGLGEGRLFLAYFREATQDGTGSGPWLQAYLQSTGDTFRLLADDEVDTPAASTEPALFDYVTETENAQAHAANAPRRATVLANNDGVIRNSLCVGTDCPNSPSFGFDTQRLQENNLRLHFDDTSNSGSFPSNDWRLTANDSGNGGQSYLSVDDATAGRQVMELRAGSQAHAIFTTGSSVGFGTDVPVTELHTVDGDTPTLRLQQDGSSGFAQQTWDVAGNEAGYFVRDVTNGGTLPFRVLPGVQNDFFVIAGTERVGVGAGTNPDELLHLERTGSTNAILKLQTATGLPRIIIDNGNADEPDCPSNDCNWILDVSGNSDFRITVDQSGEQEFLLTETGDLTVSGGLISGTPAGTCNPGPCDATFQPDKFEVPTIEEHAAFMWENSYLWGVGPTKEGMPMNVTKKTAGILHELEVAHVYIEQLNETLKAKTAEIESLNERLTRLERLLEVQDQ